MLKMFRIIMNTNIRNANLMTKIKTPMMEAQAEEVKSILFKTLQKNMINMQMKLKK